MAEADGRGACRARTALDVSAALRDWFGHAALWPSSDTVTRMSADDEIPKRKRALTLRLAGATYSAIAEEMGVSVENVHSWIRKSMDAIPRENAK